MSETEIQIQNTHDTLLALEEKEKEITKLMFILLCCDFGKLPISYLVRLGELLNV